MVEVITDKNFIQYCMNHYDNPQCQTVHEFEEDLNRIMYLQKLFNRYVENNELRRSEEHTSELQSH